MRMKLVPVVLVSLLLASPDCAEAIGLADKHGKKLIPTIIRPGTSDNTRKKLPPKRVLPTCVDLGTPSPYMTVTIRYRCENGGLLGYNGCYGACLPPPPGTPVEPEVDVRALVDTAIRLVPDPEPITSPPLTDDDDVSVVGIPFFYSVPSAQWTTISPVATQGSTFLAINATPTTLTFTPGNDRPATSCDNPGQSVRTQQRANSAKRLGCYYVYETVPRAAATFPAKLSITWTLSVTTNLAPGQFINLVPPTMTTTTEFDVPVIELQPVLVEPSD